jgi:hypothetical protein
VAVEGEEAGVDVAEEVVVDVVVAVAFVVSLDSSQSHLPGSVH